MAWAHRGWISARRAAMDSTLRGTRLRWCLRRATSVGSALDRTSAAGAVGVALVVWEVHLDLTLRRCGRVETGAVATQVTSLE